ncbi:MAG: GFA family protein [Ornithinimicrobium sp.]
MPSTDFAQGNLRSPTLSIQTWRALWWPRHDVWVEASAAGLQPSGGCACGAVQYHCVGQLRPVVNCHCPRCRRFTGHYMAATGCIASDLVLVSDSSLQWYEPSAGVFYGFCGTCGSSLFWRADGLPNWISISAGTLDQPTGLRTTEAWWVQEAADYHQLAPGLIDHPLEPHT